MSASMEVSFLALRLPFSSFLLFLHLFIFIVCHDTPEFKHILSVKTTYNNSFDDNEIEIRDSSYSIIEKICKPVQFNGIYRHGIRNPSKTDINNVDTFYRRIVNAAANNGIHPTLPLPFKIETAKALSLPGKIELQSIQKRTAKRFDSLFSSAAANQLEFISSSIGRAIGSRDAFSSAFKQFKNHMPTNQKIRDDLMRYYYTCQKYMLPHTKPKLARYHFDKFWTQSKIDRVASNIRQKLGIEKMDITVEDLHAVYSYGASVMATFGQSEWVELFDHADLKLLEYANDLKRYWKKAYGHIMNYEQSCPLLSDIFHRMDDMINGNTDKKGIFQFGHHGTLIRLLGLLGLFKDKEPLKADNFEQHTNRKFRNSRIGPFSTNLAFVLYECPPGVTPAVDSNNEDVQLPPTLERYMVQMLFKELPERFPFCPYDLCPYSEVRNHYKRYIDHCSLQDICSRKHDEL